MSNRIELNSISRLQLHGIESNSPRLNAIFLVPLTLFCSVCKDGNSFKIQNLIHLNQKKMKFGSGFGFGSWVFLRTQPKPKYQLFWGSTDWP